MGRSEAKLTRFNRDLVNKKKINSLIIDYLIIIENIM